MLQNVFIFDTFESNFIMAGFREIHGLKKLILKFNVEYKKIVSNCMNQINSMI